jgi:hypothetical protein
MQIKLPNGIELDNEKFAAPMLNKWANEKGVDCRIFYTSLQTYLLVIGETPEFESQKAEDVAVHIDILAIAGNPTKRVPDRAKSAVKKSSSTTPRKSTRRGRNANR